MDRQKLLMIFGGAALAAALLTWFLYSATVAPKAEKLVQVIAANGSLPAGTRLQAGHLKKITVAAKDVPPGVLPDEKAGVDRTLLYPLSLNEPVLTSRLSSVSGADGVASMIEPGKRAVSVSVNDASSASGLIQARSHVDVLFTKPGSMLEAVTTTVIENVVVLSVGRTVEPASAAPAAAGAAANATPAPATTGQNRAVTLLVTPEQARVLELAKNQGRVSLALRNPKDEAKSEATEPPSVTAEAIDPGGAYRSQRLKMQAQNRLRGGVPNLRDDQAWAKLIGEDPDPNKPAAAPRPPAKKEPPKPKFVIDVFRGEKHVQESFQE
ncbi:MAG: Flp pilus assembly protein CpaB [Acidobacteria bacterium]|nr:Flp pilus assembly protein CpaB [Acidobacteriota bacterium]